MPRVGFEPTTPAREKPQTHALDRAHTGIGCWYLLMVMTYYVQHCVTTTECPT
jgi:hypothetical protein